MSEISIVNVINTSVSAPGLGLGRYNTSNIALYTEEAYAPSFGSSGYKLYVDPSGVATDFGTASKTYKMSLALFSQQPNLLQGGGYLCIIPIAAEIQLVEFDAVPNGGSFILNFDGDATAPILYSDNASQVQVKVRSLTGLEGAIVSGTFAEGFSIQAVGNYGPVALMTATSNTLVSGASVPVSVDITLFSSAEDLDQAIQRTVGLVQFFGIITTLLLDMMDMLEAAAVVKPLSKMLFVVSQDPASIEPNGALDLIRSGGFTHTRGLYYGRGVEQDALNYAAAYAARGLSVNFLGSNTTLTMHLKTLQTIQPDTTLDQTLLDKAIAAGADTYPSIQGVPKVFCSGENDFFDNVYNLLAFVGDIQISGFNTLAQTPTKIPQTQNGVDMLNAGYRQVCEQYVTNQFIAPGQWTSPSTFGNQDNFYANISQFGYYIWSAPISQQLPADREDRNSPITQIAVKYAGAIHKGFVIIAVNP